MDISSVHVDSGYLSPEDVRALAAKGAVGDVVGRFITGEGRVADPDLDSRTLGLGLDDLRNARVSIAVIAGEAKHRIAHAVVASGLCTTLITDEATAGDVLGRAPDDRTPTDTMPIDREQAAL
ncbi:transcriptional regulator [Leifsonia xyli subsp. cynodontis DSM 46306]|uniref:Sugar-binding domain-containing protein n=1 Tax=Leifsonia xyli subsp. cynodontis DSM 46306 TaxID=1389489 RepID=U3P5B4_LEIXC|nr:sugar-binding domain-containing protein [Leifsonia xyli]AGW40941.1 transcriptional regulator [Leifsonia xyli subsp. cynodontis DSM 46306]